MSTKTTETLTVTTKSEMPSLAINTEALKTPSVCLKFLEVIIGAIAFGLAMKETQGYFRIETTEMRYEILVIFAFTIVTFLLLISSLVSTMAANMIPKTIFEFLFHLSGSSAYLVVTLLFTMHFVGWEEIGSQEPVLSGMSALGFLNGILYGVSTYISFKSFKAS